MKILAYSDIHHDDYTNGITLEDTIYIEDYITQYMLDHNINDVLFCGDWYRATNPIQKVIKEAEASWVRRSNKNLHTLAMTGNHDRWTKSNISGHAFKCANIFSNDLNNVSIFDEIKVYTLNNVDILFLPAGWENAPVQFNKIRPLIVVFHGLITGSYLASGMKANGIDPEVIKKLHPDLILGGDNHTPQAMDIFDCPAYYLGAPLQHNWGDRDQDRGFWQIEFNNNIFSCNMINTETPRFIKKQVNANTEIEAICNILSVININVPFIAEITLIGKNATNLDVNFIEQNIKNSLVINNRRLKIIVDKTYDNIEITQKIGEANTPEAKWDTYIIHSNAAGIDTMDSKKLSEIGKWAIQQSKTSITN